MADNSVPVTIAGGSIEWGGLVNRGDRLGLKPNESSDCQDVYEDHGKLRKRKGYTSGIKNTAGFPLVNRCSMDVTVTGAVACRSGDNRQVSMEVDLDGTYGTLSRESGSLDVVVAIELTRDGTPSSGDVWVELYTADVSKYPDSLIATSKKADAEYLPSSGWIYFCFDDVTISSDNICVVLNGDYTVSGSDYISWRRGTNASGNVASYYDDNLGSWQTSAGVEHNVKVFQRSGSEDAKYISISSYKDYYGGKSSCGASFTNDKHSCTINTTDSSVDYTGYTLFVSGDTTHYKIIGKGTGTNTYVIYPNYEGTTGGKQGYLAPKKLIVAFSCDWSAQKQSICESPYNIDWPIEIVGGTFASGTYMQRVRTAMFQEVDSFMGLAIAGESMDSTTVAPQVWGTSSYPVTGSPGNFAFTGLTNPIQRAGTLMFHKNAMFWGDVTINGTDYANRIYESAIGTPEAGYSDTRYILRENKITAMLSVGEYAIISTLSDTYIMFGETYYDFEFKKHFVPGGAVSHEALCVLKKDKRGEKRVFGISDQGFFEINRMEKKYIHHKIADELDGVYYNNVNVYIDEDLGYVCFSVSFASGRKTFAYDPIKERWWKLTYKITSAIFKDEPLENRGVIYGIDGTETISGIMRVSNSDVADGTTAINAYYKIAPFYINRSQEFVPMQLWVTARNESATSNLTINHYNDYSEATGSPYTMSLYDSSYPANVPMRLKQGLTGRANAIEIKLSQNSATQTFAIQEVVVDIKGRQNVEQAK